MTLDDYLAHYFIWKDMLTFFLIAIGGLIVSLAILLICSRLISTSVPKKKQAAFFYNKTNNLVERFYEMIFSGTSILSFLAAYYLIDRFVTTGSFRVFWDKHSDMLLLVMIILSCVINSFLDRIFVPLKSIDKEQKASVRMIGMLYIILIFMYIKFIYENNNYDGFITYFLGLMVGRFAYFDASFSDFVKSVKLAALNLPLLILGLCYTGFMCFIGFSSKYLLISNGVLVSTFIAHLFMVVSIFLIYHCRILNLIVKKPKKGMPRQNQGQPMDAIPNDKAMTAAPINNPYPPNFYQDDSLYYPDDYIGEDEY